MSRQKALIEGDSEEAELLSSSKVRCFVTASLRKNTPEERVRQEVARSLVEEYGYAKSDIAIEFPIKMGRARKRADIVVLAEGKKHEQENIQLIIEVKAESVKPSDKKEGVDQLASYVAASPNCAFALWIGNERLAFELVGHEGERQLRRIPDVPRRGVTTIQKPVRGSLVPAIGLKQVFRRVHNFIYANQGLQKDKAFEELQKLIFIKVFDEQFNPSLQFYALRGEEAPEIRKRLLDVFYRVQGMYRYIFKGDEKIELNDQVLAYATSELQRFSLVDTETDVKGEAYEEIVGPNLRGDRGEFFTPRNVCHMTMKMVLSFFPEEQIATPGGLKILDPAVGTGGFLIAGIQLLKTLFIKRGVKYDRLRDLVKDVVDLNFHGIDFNPFLVRVAQMNMVMHGDGSSNIYHANSLDKPSNWTSETRNVINLGQFDIVVTNPPFGTKSLVDSADILGQYELASLKSATSSTAMPPEQLFVERCLDFLKPGGILGIVLPDSILTNPGLAWIRRWILGKTCVLASIDLPTETFEPHTGTQTSVLLLKKKPPGRQKKEDDYEIFMAIPRKVGHDRRGNPIYRSTPEGTAELDGSGNPIVADDLPIIADVFQRWAKEKGVV